MPNITLTDPTTGTTVASGLFATNNSNLRALLNGGLDYLNFKGVPALVSGETVVWNGTQFDRSTVTRIGATSLGSGTPTSSNFLRGDGSWQTVSAGPTITYATTPPGSPATGDIWYCVDSTTLPTFQWAFRYNGSSSNTDKWEFIGGAEAEHDITTVETTSSTTYVDLSTVGPTITVPRGGVYLIRFSVGYTLNTSSTGAGVQRWAAVKLGAAAASDNEGSMSQDDGTTSIGSALAWQGRRTLAASDVVKVQYRASSGTGNFGRRSMVVTPVRVS